MNNANNAVPEDANLAAEAASVTEETGMDEAETITASSEEAVAAGQGTAEQLATLQKERDDYLDQWRRSAAEFQNFKKREERLRVERERAANSRLLRKLLPVMDDLQRGAQHVPEDFKQSDWVNGMLAIERKLWTVLEQEGVSVVDAEPGTEFDPTVHDALISEESTEVESGQITGELERGYKYNETILRPARVRVAR